MPKTKKERIIYITSLCFLMTYFLGIVNGAITQNGLSWKVIWMVTKQEPAVYSFAVCIALAGIQKLAMKASSKVSEPKDSENAKIMIMSFFMVLFMSPCIAVYRLILANGISKDIFGLFLQSWTRNFTIALLYQLSIAGPLARRILKIFRDNVY